MCNKCEIFHSKLLQNHQVINIDEINNDKKHNAFCEQQNHNIELQYFCRNHNILCCAKCITKIKDKENGLHKDCDVCTIEDIKNEKMIKLNENIQNLELLSKNLQESINNLKNIYEKVSQNKEEIQTKIQKIFTKIRNEINNREDLLLKEVEEIFSKTYFGEEIIKQGEKLISLINDCLDIENNINEINRINGNINKYNDLTEVKVILYPKEDDTQFVKLIETINNFGNLYKSNDSLLVSSIINIDNDKQILIIKWIEEKINKKGPQFKLIFRMSKDGYDCNDFHKYCDNQGPTLILIQTTNNKIFGGFTPLNWKNSGNKIKDPYNQTFIFSLNLNKKYNLINGDKPAIKCSKEFGPNFGNDDIELKINLKEGLCYADNSCSYICNGVTELTGEKRKEDHFETKELEVFKVSY